MIKVPGTAAGSVALRRLIADGINVNVTLLFARSAYADIIDAYLAGLEDRARAGGALGHVASVASFFVSRIDTEVDRRLEALGSPAALRWRGTAAVANAQLAYALFRERFSGARWAPLAALGAQIQRPLWASTGTKNHAYSDVKYIEALIGPDTVNTVPPATLDAFLNHGKVARTVDADVDAARGAIAHIEALGVSLTEVTDKLLADGIKAFEKSFETLLAGIDRKMSAVTHAGSGGARVSTGT